jgi:hypothetical protein
VGIVGIVGIGGAVGIVGIGGAVGIAGIELRALFIISEALAAASCVCFARLSNPCFIEEETVSASCEI